MTDARGDGPSRRSVLAGAGLLLVAACTGSATVGPPELTADQRLARSAAEEITALTASYAATMAAYPQTRTSLGPLAAEHEAHLSALVAWQPSPTTTPTTTPTGSATASASPSPVAPSATAARGALAGAEQAASQHRSVQTGRAGPELARLLASIAACEAVHATLVAS